VSGVRIAAGTWLRRGVPAVATGLVAVATLAAGSPAQASAAAGTHAAAARAAASGGTWGTAEEVPGVGALAVDGSSYALSVSCGAPGSCSAGGYYTTFVNEPGPVGAFVVSETGGTWGNAEEVPGTAALNQGGYAVLNSVSCPSAGDCSAGGYYTNGSGDQEAFVVSETGGTWGNAEEVAGTLNQGVLAGIESVSCASAGNCSAGGSYRDGSGNDQAFVVTEKGGTWGTAKEVPGTAALNKGGSAVLNSVSCTSAGNCSAGGRYLDSSGDGQAFVVGETNGTWGTAKEVPGTAALNKGGSAVLNSVSCASAGNCSAGGGYAGSPNGSSGELFVVGETNGTWGTAKEVPGFSALNKGMSANLGQVSCASVGHCSAVGYYTTQTGDGGFNEAFAVNET
jgi:hypothetical protein